MKNKKNKAKAVIDNTMQIMYSDTDPFGSYTGVVNPSDEDQRPVQDADDL